MEMKKKNNFQKSLRSYIFNFNYVIFFGDVSESNVLYQQNDA
jgi:hypothetical protein